MDAPAAAPVRPVTDSYFGTAVTDNYRYMEDLKNPEVQGWMHAEADYTRATIDALPGRKALLDRIHDLSNSDPRRGDYDGYRWRSKACWPTTRTWQPSPW